MTSTIRTAVVCLALFPPTVGSALAADAPSTPSAASPASLAGVLRVVIQVDENDEGRWNLALDNIRNAQKDVGAKNIDIELVAYGPGVAMLQDDSLVANRVQVAMAAGVRFVACRNTMQAKHLTEDEMIPGIGYVQAGVVEIIRKQMEGFAYLRP